MDDSVNVPVPDDDVDALFTSGAETGVDDDDDDDEDAESETILPHDDDDDEDAEYDELISEVEREAENAEVIKLKEENERLQKEIVMLKEFMPETKAVGMQTEHDQRDQQHIDLINKQHDKQYIHKQHLHDWLEENGYMQGTRNEGEMIAAVETMREKAAEFNLYLVYLGKLTDFIRDTLGGLFKLSKKNLP